MPETKIGYSPDVGAHYYLAQLDGNIGAWLAVTGQTIYGRAVYELGIATHYVSPSSIQDIIFQISQLSTPNSSQISELVAAYMPPPPTAAEKETTSSNKTRGSPSAITGEIRAYLDKTFEKKSVQEIHEALGSAENEDVSDRVKAWAKEQKEMMDERSPTGMAVALEGYRRAKSDMRLDKALLDGMLYMPPALTSRHIDGYRFCCMYVNAIRTDKIGTTTGLARFYSGCNSSLDRQIKTQNQSNLVALITQ